MSKPLVLVLAGPTASGKSSAAIELCKLLGGEVISADSMQLYKGMDIGTAKATKKEQLQVPHHLLSIAAPDHIFSAAEYRELALEVIKDIHARGKVPVLCGGTGLYIDAVTKPMGFASQKRDEALRRHLENVADEADGRKRLHEQLTAVDPESAARLHPNDTRRVIRALEIYTLTGKTIGQLAEEDKKLELDFDVVAFAIDYPRERLYQRIDDRVDQMMEEGLVAEVQSLVKDGFKKDSTAMQAIGYKEVVWALEGEISMERAVELIKQASRNYAKRQLTWFRRDERINWIEGSGKTSKAIADEMCAIYKVDTHKPL